MSKNRVVWVDVGKGVSILGVVLFHAILIGGVNDTWANSISIHLDEVRMSLFFVLSGLFAHKIARMTPTQLFRRKIWVWGAPYVIWCGTTYVVFGLTGNRAADHGYLEYILFPENGMWFLYALTTYAVMTYVTRTMPSVVVFWLSLCLCVLGSLTMPYGDNWGVMRVFMFAPFFFGGLYAREFLLSISTVKRGWKWWVSAFGVISVCAWMSVKGKAIIFDSLVPLDSPDYDSRLEAWKLTMSLDIGYVGSIGLAIIGAVVLSYVPVLRSVLIYFGKRTLPIYLVNEMAIASWCFFVEVQHPDAPAVQWLSSHPEVRVWAIFGGTVAVGLLLHYVSTIPYFGGVVIPRTLPAMPWEKDGRETVARHAKQGGVSGVISEVTHQHTIPYFKAVSRADKRLERT